MSELPRAQVAPPGMRQVRPLQGPRSARDEGSVTAGFPIVCESDREDERLFRTEGPRRQEAMDHIVRQSAGLEFTRLESSRLECSHPASAPEGMCRCR